MARKQAPNTWKGEEGKILRGEPLMRFKCPKSTKAPMQQSYGLWNWRDKVLAVTIWKRYDSVVDSGKTKTQASRYIRSILNPDRQMCIAISDCLKSDGKYVCNYQYFAKLDKCPDNEKMIKLFDAFDEKAVPMSRAEYERRKYDYYHDKYKDKYRQDSLMGLDTDDD